MFYQILRKLVVFLAAVEALGKAKGFLRSFHKIVDYQISRVILYSDYKKILIVFYFWV